MSIDRADDDNADYSYDLAHEDVTAPDPARAPSTAESAGAPAPEHRPDLDVGDLSYDLAHEVPPAERE